MAPLSHEHDDDVVGQTDGDNGADDPSESEDTALLLMTTMARWTTPHTTHGPHVSTIF